MIKNSSAKITIIMHKFRKTVAALCLMLILVFVASYGIFSNITANAAGAINERVFNPAYDTAQGFAYGSGDGKNEETAFLIATPAHLDNVHNYASNNIFIDDNGSFPDEDYIPGSADEEYEPDDGDDIPDSNVEDYMPGFEVPVPAYYFKVINDIDMEKYLSEGGDGYKKWNKEGWLPIDSFKGVFDGGLYAIKNLWIDRPEENGIGLFDTCRQGTIKNIRLELAGKGITGYQFVGGIVALLQNIESGKEGAQISSCFVSGTVRAVNEEMPIDVDNWDIMSYVGGIVGKVLNGTITKCWFNGEVSGLSVVGGIAGENLSGSVSDCLSYGRITLASDKDYIPIAGAGGVIGVSHGYGGFYGTSTVKNCFYMGTQTDLRLAGIVGFRTDINSGGGIGVYSGLPAITGCYYSSGFTGSMTFIESLVENDQKSCDGWYYDEEFDEMLFDENLISIVYDEFSSINSRALTTKEMKNKSSYKGWDFIDTWGFDKKGNLVLQKFGNSYNPPSLTWLWITLSCILFGGITVSSGHILYRRKKVEVVTQKETVYVKIPNQCLPDSLTVREHEVAKLILEGHSRFMISEKLFISESTVKKHIQNIFEKTNCTTQKEFIVKFK